jgi:hypothetical protein
VLRRQCLNYHQIERVSTRDAYGNQKDPPLPISKTSSLTCDCSGCCSSFSKPAFRCINPQAKRVDVGLAGSQSIRLNEGRQYE